MRTIRGWAAGAAVLLASLGATEATAKQIYLDEIIRMSSAGVLEEIIMSEVIVTKSVFELSPDDIVRLSEAGLSDQLIQFLIDTGRPEGSKTVDLDPDDRPLPDFEDDDLVSTGATDTPGTPITLDDVIWMNASGVLDEIIMSEVVATESVFVLTPKDIIRLSQAGISDDLIQFLMETGEQAEDSTSEPQLAVPDYEDDDTDVYLGFGFNYGYYGAWYDPWYYSYSPYCLSFSWGWGYPGWYYTPYCWSSYGYGYCGYGYAPYCGYGWSGYSGDCFATGGYPGGYPGGAYGLSTEKWKTNGGAAGSPLALKEPRVADYSPKLASLEKAAPGEGPSVRDYAKVDSKSLDERVRPVRNTRPTRSVKAPRANDGSVKYAHVAPDRVREPAKGSKPSKVTKAATNSNGKVSRSKAIEPGGKGTKSKSTVVRPTAKSSGKSSTAVYRTARATRTPSGGKSSPAVRSAPTSRSSHVVRSTPTRSSAPTRSMSTGRSAPSYRSAPVRSSYGSGGGRSYGGGYGGGRASGGGGRGR